MTDTVCDLALPGPFPAPSPFGRIVALAYDDGPTVGAVACAAGEAAYRFDVLAIDVDGVHDRAAWDRGEEVRVFALAPLPAGTFDRIVETLSEVEQPNWPVWVPGGGDPTGSVAGAIEREIDPLIEAAGPPTAVLAAASLLGPIAGARRFPDSGGVGERDWFSLLGFRREESVAPPR